ncbi:arginine--tRNA ligase [Notoacmeibacter sp. MSK16QG-6]|uniref:arginine--tRNA ligase n=1 Tax=Notoacmeibacter sp. MSK16QG-6 TaxID=2957982 RepID=UPI00209DCD8F|nr:arginine--tRNA ligase [Notoacmeibacter sp. MSK16QG-6]MCP1199394.1 arginine--tRNA ligase [Notoacmeibacter sp. MSK16QG-6]
MNLFADFAQRIRSVVQAFDLKNKEGNVPDLSRMTVEPPRDASHGDLATNVAMVLAKPLGLKPRELAQTVADELSKDADIASVEVAGPGFINLRLADGFWHNQLRTMLDAGEEYGRSEVGAGRSTNVEYVSANPTGPMHVGHCRGAVVGDALARLLAFAGYDVTREYYVNDAGGQIGVLGQSVLLRYREALGETIDIPEGLYPGDYLVPVGQALAAKHGDALLKMEDQEALAIAKDEAVAMMMDLIRDDLAALNIRHDVFFSERTLHGGNGGRIGTAVDDLREKGFVYTGTLPPPKGQLPEDWEDREQVLFRSTEVGDDIDRPLVKSDGSYTYFAADVAYMGDKFGRGFDKLIFVLGADHGGYVKRMEALARAVSEKIDIDVLLCQLVKLYRDGEPVRMGKRTGNFVTLRDVVDEVGVDAVRFMMLYRKADAPLDFDFAKVTEQSKDNPVFYVQYASARAHSIIRQAIEAFGPDVAGEQGIGDGAVALTDEGELALIRKLAEWPRLVEAAAGAMEPHRIAFYLYDLASAFHAHYNRGTDNAQLRFVKHDDAVLTRARLGLVMAVRNVLSAGLAITGASAPEEMR